jgi:flagellar protein FlaF
MSLQNYKTAQDVTGEPRQTEYRLFALVTKALMDAEEVGSKSFYAAVDWNRRLWLTLQMDLAAPENTLSDDLKAQLISLSIWVDKHSSKALRGEAKIDPLISVNRTIMEGLV